MGQEYQLVTHIDPVNHLCIDDGGDQLPQVYTVIHLSTEDLSQIQDEYRTASQERLLSAIKEVGKKGLAFAVGLFDALTAASVLLGLPGEIPLPWEESDTDLAFKQAGYTTGMAANIFMAGTGTYMVDQGLATATVCGTVAGGGALAAETGVGVIVAEGGGVCAVGALAEAGIGAAMTGLGGANLVKVNVNYAKGESFDAMGGNHIKNNQFRAAARRALSKMGISPQSEQGRQIMRQAHEYLRTSGGAGSFSDIIQVLEWSMLGAGGIILITESSPQP